MLNGLSAIENSVVLFRIIRKGLGYQQDPPQHWITAANFVLRPIRDKNDGTRFRESGLSLARADSISANKLLQVFLQGRDSSGYQVGQSTAGAIRAVGFDVFASPTPNLPGHVSLRCTTCNMELRDCVLKTGSECELEDLERRKRLSEVFSRAELD